MREEAVGWVLRLDAPEATPRDREAFEIWLSHHPDHRLHYDAAALVFRASGQALRQRAPRAASRARIFVPLALVAGVALFFLVGGPLRWQADAIAGAGQQPVVALPDGSRVQLDASAAISFTFDGQRREVRLLRGQAFFQVAPDAARPFVVVAARGETRALGTAFEVGLTDKGAAVAVAEHSVLVQAAGGAEVVLRVGQRVDYADGKLGSVGSVDMQALAAWRQGRLVADNATLGWIAEQLEMRLSGRILIPSESLRERRVSGTFDIRDPAGALGLLERSLGLNAIHLGPLLTVLR